MVRTLAEYEAWLAAKEKRKSQIEALYRRGLSQHQIARIIGVSQPAKGAGMRFRNDDGPWSLPEPYNTIKEWNLTYGGSSSAEGTKTVYVLVCDAADNWTPETEAVSATTIEYIREPDTTPPSSTITDPADGATVSAKVYTIKGTASDDKSGVDLVEVSTDGGTTWQRATGTISWQYDWTLPADGTYILKSRATDRNGNIETPGDGIRVTVYNMPGVSTPTGLRATVKGNTVTIQWDDNSETDIDYYNIYVGYSSRNYNMAGSPFNVGNITSLTASDVPEGTYYLALSAVNSAGQESSLSEEIKVVVSTKPIIIISSNKTSYAPGNTFTLSFSLSNPTTTARIVDVFLGIIAPDGSIYFFDSSLFQRNLVLAKADDSRTFTPASTSLELSPGYDFPLTSFFFTVLPTGLPDGIYQAFAALAEPGSVQAGSLRIISDISLAPFSFTQ